MVDFSGKWTEVKFINAEPLLELMGVPEEMRKIIMEHKKVCTIEQEGQESMKVVAHTPKGPQNMTFKLDGSEQEIDDFLCGKLKASPHWEGETLVMEMEVKGKKGQMVRRMDGDQMIVDMTFEGKTVTSVWEKC